MKNTVFYLLTAVMLVLSAACTNELYEKNAVTGVTISESTVMLKPGETATVSATVEPAGACDVVWSSSDDLVATVSPSGEITAKGWGTASIIATTTTGGKVATCAVYVNPTRVSRVELDRKEFSSKIDGKVVLTATVFPEDATNKTIVWTSSDAAVATVSAGGLVTVVSAEGGKTAVITAMSGDSPNLLDTCTVTVLPETEEERLNRFIHRNSSKTWTWDPETANPWGNGGWLASTGPAWWVIGHADLAGQVGEGEGQGATMTFEAPDKIILTQSNGTVLEGTYRLDFTRTIQEGWSIGYLVITGGPEDLTILGGKAQMEGVIHKEIPILKLEENTVVFSLINDFGAGAWSTAYFYVFGAVESE